MKRFGFDLAVFTFAAFIVLVITGSVKPEKHNSGMKFTTVADGWPVPKRPVLVADGWPVPKRPVLVADGWPVPKRPLMTVDGWPVPKRPVLAADGWPVPKRPRAA